MGTCERKDCVTDMTWANITVLDRGHEFEELFWLKTPWNSLTSAASFLFSYLSGEISKTVSQHIFPLRTSDHYIWHQI